MRGILLRGDDGVNFDRLMAEGIRFAVLSATAGKDRITPHFYENASAARRAGMTVAVYHDLEAATMADALAEAEHFRRVLFSLDAPPLWAMCRVESPFLPRNRQTLSCMTGVFLEKIRGLGYRPMLYTTEDFLKTRLAPRTSFDLCLARWSVPEANALVRNPRIWEYGEGKAGDIPHAILLRGYFPISAGNPAGIF